MLELRQLFQRREDLAKIRASEKNRLQAPGNSFVRESIKENIDFLYKQIALLTDQIESIIEANEYLKECKAVLQTIPGIGSATASKMLIAIPELGEASKKQIASLSGLAPRANDSGTKQGYRRTNKGRSEIKSIMFPAAMGARNSYSRLKEFYQSLIARGKKKMVALIALMRKILVIANAKLKEVRKMKLA